ncbi:metalloregulator ArsR/SmtB family transcription factor [Chitinophaga sp.]|uniref:ArsR/SmtB family transcription factor n=1 Tax=Chitinophaga sp. TaxID=1869181 RepID=UPI0031D26915
MEARRDVFQAIADPTRREIIHLVAHEPRHLNAIAANFDMTRQAISLHIKILEECGLIEIRQQGRERICAARLEKLQEVQDWIRQYESFWQHKMQALKNFLEDNSSPRKSKKK